MRREKVTLPALPLAAAAFFLSSTAAAATPTDVFCVDASSAIVPKANCDGNAAAGKYFLAHGKVQLTGEKVDSTDAAARSAAGFKAAQLNLKAGGFGKRDDTEENQADDDEDKKKKKDKKKKERKKKPNSGGS